MPRVHREPSGIATRLALQGAAEGLTIGEIAAATGSSRSAAYRWRQGEREMPVGVAAGFARALGMRLEVVKLGQGRLAPCGHKVPLPRDAVRPEDLKVACTQCQTKYEWTMVEVEQ